MKRRAPRTGKKGSDKGIDGIKVFVDDNSGKAKRLQAFRSFIGENQMMAYLVMMAVRSGS